MQYQIRYNVPGGPFLYHEFDSVDVSGAELEALGVANLPVALSDVSQVDISKVSDRTDLQAPVATKTSENALLAEAADKAAAELKIQFLVETYAVDLDKVKADIAAKR